jgi:hypothetical protein
MEEKESDTCEIFMWIPPEHLADSRDGEVTLN